MFDIVIVNWNSGTQLKECLDSIYKISNNNKLNKIIIVDKASTDMSIELIIDNKFNVEIIRNSINEGFGKACNQGASLAKSELILFLNPDVKVFVDTFKNMYQFGQVEQEKETAIFGVQLVDDKNNIQRTCARFPTMTSFLISSFGLNKINSSIFKSYTMENWNHKESSYVDQVIGAFFLVRREIFEQLNGFDERFFVYYEELDFSKRVADYGCKTKFIAEAQAYHKGGGTSESVKAKRLFYNLRSRLIYAYKHFGLTKGVFLMLSTFIVEPMTRSIFLMLTGRVPELSDMYRGIGMLYIDTMNIIKLGVKK